MSDHATIRKLLEAISSPETVWDRTKVWPLAIERLVDLNSPLAHRVLECCCQRPQTDGEDVKEDFISVGSFRKGWKDIPEEHLSKPQRMRLIGMSACAAFRKHSCLPERKWEMRVIPLLFLCAPTSVEASAAAQLMAQSALAGTKPPFGKPPLRVLVSPTWYPSHPKRPSRVSALERILRYEPKSGELIQWAALVRALLPAHRKMVNSLDS